MDEQTKPIDSQSIIPQSPRSSKNILIIISVLAVFALLGVYLFLFQNKRSNPSENMPTTAVNATETPTNLKTLTLDTMKFNYPSTWKDPSYVQTSTGQSAEIKNQNDTARMVILSGINKGYSEQELSEFINQLVQGGAEKITIDGSEAAKSQVTLQGSKITTLYVTAKDKKSQYSISLQAAESYPDQELDTLLDTIFSTLKFTQ